MKFQRTFLILALSIFLTFYNSGVFSALAAKEKLPEHHYGCDCASLQSCVAAGCATIPGMQIACISSEGRQAVICWCKKGGMKHCSNWDQLISESGCGNLLDDYCNGGGSSDKCWEGDTVCHG